MAIKTLKNLAIDRGAGLKAEPAGTDALLAEQSDEQPVYFTIASLPISTAAQAALDALNTSLTALGASQIQKAGTPAAGQYARFTDASTIEGRTAAQARTDLEITAANVTVDPSGNLTADVQTSLEALDGVKVESSALGPQLPSPLPDDPTITFLATDPITTGALNYAQVSGGEITAGTETAPRSSSPADIVSFITQHAPGGGLGAPETDAATSIIIGADIAGEHHGMSSDSAITAYLDPEAPALTVAAIEKNGAGAVTVQAASSLPFSTGDNAGGTPAVGETVADQSGASATVLEVRITSGTFAGGNAAGTVIVGPVTSAPFTAEALDFSGGGTATATAAESAAGYLSEGQDLSEAPVTTAFGITGLEFFICWANADNVSAVWKSYGADNRAKTVSGDHTFSDDVAVTGTFDVDGATTLDGLTVAEAANFDSTVDFDEDVTVSNDMTFDGSGKFLVGGGNVQYGFAVTPVTTGGTLDSTHIGKLITTNASFTIPTTPTGWWAVFILGNAAHDPTFDGSATDVSALGWGAGDHILVHVTSSTTCFAVRTAAANITAL